MNTETITLINGNHRQVKHELPTLLHLGYINDIALEHIYENTGLTFRKIRENQYEVKPHSSWQIVALFMTYNFKTRHYDNWELKNTIVLKPDHHVGFDVESICFDCCKENNINTNGLEPGDRLAC